MNLKQTNHVLKEFAMICNKHDTDKKIKVNGPLKVGIDLGTSSIVIAVLNQENQPLYGNFQYADVVRDGIVVNYMESVKIVRRLKSEAENYLGVELETACGAIPPGTGVSSEKIVENVLGDAGFEVTKIIDEPTAAAKFLHIETGSVIDIGGGTTGVSNFESYQATSTFDEPTGGYHMSLVLAGHERLSVDEAELLKRTSKEEHVIFGVIRPVVEKMAYITKQYVQAGPNAPVYLVGGSTNFSEFVTVFSKTLGRDVIRPDYPQFVTPLGIAMYD